MPYTEDGRMSPAVGILVPYRHDQYSDYQDDECVRNAAECGACEKLQRLKESLNVGETTHRHESRAALRSPWQLLSI